MDAGVPPSLLRVLAAGAQSAWPPGSDDDADRLLAQAGREGLPPPLFATPGPGLAAGGANIFQRGVGAAARALGDEPFVVWKGADYASRLYARPELRPMQDLDLLVPRARLGEACRRLERAGAQRRPARNASARASSYHERAYVLGDVVVELHQAFVQRARHRVDYDGLWARRGAARAPGAAA